MKAYQGRSFHKTITTLKSRHLVAFLMTLMIAAGHVTFVCSRYVPYAISMGQQDDDLLRRQDFEDDDMDSTASAPYQNQDNTGDGYDDSEQGEDGPYEETPREQEGQADLERFFDDHLGASDREGMDKENLPSNLVPIMLDSPPNGAMVAKSAPPPVTQSARDIEFMDTSPTLETIYTKLPDQKLIITSQITRNMGSIDDEQLRRRPHRPLVVPIVVTQQIDPMQDSNNLKQARDSLDSNSSDIVMTENDDYDRVYVTNATNKPFRIEALGGYDPEEDFADASRDIEELARHDNGHGGKGDSSNRKEELSNGRDITFNDPETDTLFEDASETDEVTFSHDDPYQTDLEAEMRRQLYDQVSNTRPDPSASKLSETSQPDTNTRREDDDEGGWVNDGVDDMDIPSQSHQNLVLEKAAQRDVAARRANEAQAGYDQAQPAEGGDQEGDGESQRMPNADYLKDDLKEDDSGY